MSARQWYRHDVLYVLEDASVYVSPAFEGGWERVTLDKEGNKIGYLKSEERLVAMLSGNTWQGNIIENVSMSFIVELVQKTYNKSWGEI